GCRLFQNNPIDIEDIRAESKSGPGTSPSPSRAHPRPIAAPEGHRRDLDEPGISGTVRGQYMGATSWTTVTKPWLARRVRRLIGTGPVGRLSGHEAEHASVPAEREPGEAPATANIVGGGSGPHPERVSIREGFLQHRDLESRLLTLATFNTVS